MWEFLRNPCRQHFALIAFLGVAIATPAAAAEVGAARAIFDAVIEFAGQSIALGYRAAPALMLGMIMLCAIPCIALLARLRQEFDFSGGAPVHPFVDDGDEAHPQEPEPPGHAFLEVVGSANSHFDILHDMLRIGRAEDNDIRITSEGVHGYHAAIYREDFGDYTITDLTGLDGSGVIVNGRHCDAARLHDGDIIELGPGRLRFHAGLV